MEDFWAIYIEPSGRPGLDYWNYFAQRVVDLAAIPAGAAVLDVGTCDGNVLFKAMKKAGVQGCGTGIDIDAYFFKDGVMRANELGLGNVAFTQMDAGCLGLSSETYDSVLANFVGWDDCFDFDRMEFIAPDRKLAEIMRVLKSGGQVGIGSWERQEDLEWLGEHFRRYFPEYVADLERETGSVMMVYGKENAKGLESILRKGGCQDIEIITETAEFVSTDEEEWWRQMWRAGWRQHIGQVTRADSDKLEWLKERVFEDLQQHKHNDGIHFSKTVLFAFGRKKL